MNIRMNRESRRVGRLSVSRFAAVAGLGLWFVAASAAQTGLPKGEALLDKSIEAAGGKAAYEKIKTKKITATIEMAAMGLKGTVVSWQAPPNKMYSCTDLTGMGKIEEGVSGEVAWQVSAMTGPQVKEGEERALALRAALYNSEADWRAVYKSAECVAEEKLDEKACYKLVLTPKDGGKPETHYVEKETGHIIRVDLTLVTQMGELPIETRLSDFRKEGDITIAHKTVQKVATAEVVITIDKFEANVEIPGDRFDYPADIQALLKKASSAPATTAPADRAPTPKPAEKAGDKPAEKKP